MQAKSKRTIGPRAKGYVGTCTGAREVLPQIPKVHFYTLPPERNPGSSVVGVGQATPEHIVAGRRYLTRQAAILLKFAKTTNDPNLAAFLVEKAADLKSQVEETGKPDTSPVAPDVEPSPDL